MGRKKSNKARLTTDRPKAIERLAIRPFKSNYPRGEAPLPDSHEKSLIDSYFGLLRATLAATLLHVVLTTTWILTSQRAEHSLRGSPIDFFYNSALPYVALVGFVLVWLMALRHVRTIGRALGWPDNRTLTMVLTILFYNCCPGPGILVNLYVLFLAGRLLKKIGIPSHWYGFVRAECYAYLRVKAKEAEPPPPLPPY